MHDVYRLTISTGEREMLIQNDTNVAGWITDLAGNVRLALRQTEDGGSEMLVVDEGKLGKAIYACNYEESCSPSGFHKDGKQVYITSDKGDDVDLARLMLLDVESGATQLIESDPEGEVDFGGAVFSDATDELIATVYVGDRVRIYPRTKQFKRDLRILRDKLPDGELGVSSTTEDMSRWVVSVERDVNPGEVYLYDRKKGSVEKLYDYRPDLPSEHLATVQPVRYTARDGQEIPAYLTVPRGAEAKGLPTVLLPHGGPWGRDTWGYDSLAQFLANRGYAVFQPNFRGSTGYGKAFLNAGNKEWGTGVMQHDLSDAVKYLVAEGIADPKLVAIMGGSYGGYATLAGVTFTPDLYAAGVSIVGPSNIITLLDSIPPYWGPIKKMFHKRVGDPDDPEDRKRLEAQSPFFHAKQIKAPLLVLQGANDPRVKKAESDQIVVAMREAKRPVEYFVASDEGHGFAGKENRLAMFAIIEEFLAGHVGGRHQEGSAPEIGERIASLRVDIGTVELPQVHGGVELAKTAPLPETDVSGLEPLTLQYSSELNMMGQQMTVASTRELQTESLDDQPVWRVETRAETPMGAAKDVFYLDAERLWPLRRAVTQGPVQVSLEYTEGTITGIMKLPGQEMPIEVKLEAPVFGNEAALEAALAALPLAAGYKTTFRTFDLNSQKVRLWSFEVTGTESVEVPAGKFETFKVMMEAIDGNGGSGTIWISSDMPRKTVRSEFELPPTAGGGSVTMQLTSVGPAG